MLNEHIAFCSGGKDSAATLILAKENGDPLDTVVFSEVMFDETTSGEHPLHIDFVYSKLKPFVERKLKIPFIILRSPKNYIDFFNHILQRGAGKGKTHGFPIPGMCAINRDCKLMPIRKFMKDNAQNCKSEYVGIAADEPIRLKRLEGTNRTSLLNKYGYTESMAKDLCKDYDLLSPVYEISKRNGCWFCMNCGDSEWVWLMKNKPEFVERLIQLEKTDNLFRLCLTRTETPSQLFERLTPAADQITIFDLMKI